MFSQSAQEALEAIRGMCLDHMQAELDDMIAKRAASPSSDLQAAPEHGVTALIAPGSSDFSFSRRAPLGANPGVMLNVDSSTYKPRLNKGAAGYLEIDVTISVFYQDIQDPYYTAVALRLYARALVRTCRKFFYAEKYREHAHIVTMRFREAEAAASFVDKYDADGIDITAGDVPMYEIIEIPCTVVQQIQQESV